ncbi:MAG: NADP-dependent malic enzyme, partial [Ramlibacter sp.]|nr:NADP-dependent malic enzyme [Ramlibacter sp.]
IAKLAKLEVSDEVAHAYVGQELSFGPEYIIPKPFDSRLILHIAPAVAKAAQESGVATRPIEDLRAYRDSLNTFVTQTGMFMRPVFNSARSVPAGQKRIAYAEGEDERVLRAAQQALDDGIAEPILIGRPDIIESRIQKLGLHIRIGEGVGVIDPEDDPRFRSYWEEYHRCMGRHGVSPEAAKIAVRRSNTVIAALAVKLGDADSMVCGTIGSYDKHLETVNNIIGTQSGEKLAALNAVILEKQTLFVADTYVNENPTAEELAHIALLAAKEVQRFGIEPRVAFLSHSNFGTSNRASAVKMREAYQAFRKLAPGIECEGEMQGDSALSSELRNGFLPENQMNGSANLLICPNLDAANILFNVLKITGGHGLTIGPMLLGAAAPANILTPSATMRRVLNQTALAVVGANARRAK